MAQRLGLPRLLPILNHAPLIVLFVPQFLVLGLLVFWMIRVRLTPWLEHAALAWSA
jgi:hypothetical protein